MNPIPIKSNEHVEDEERGFPPRPHNTISFGTGGAIWPFKEMSNLRNQKYDPKHTFCTSLDWTTGKPTAPCPHKSKKKTCLFAHRWSELKRPSDYKTYEGEDAIITVRSWHHQTSHDMALTKIFPTKLTYYQLYVEKRQKLEGVVCYNFLFHGKCPYWANCTFVHPNLDDFKRELQTQFCPTRPSNSCQFLPRCPYAHLPNELLIPKEFTLKDLTASSETLIKVYYDTFEEDVPLPYVALTEGRNQALEQGVKFALCQDMCDLWRYCDKIHLVKQFWDENPTTQLPSHPTLRYAKGYLGGNSIVQRVSSKDLTGTKNSGTSLKSFSVWNKPHPFSVSSPTSSSSSTSNSSNNPSKPSPSPSIPIFPNDETNSNPSNQLVGNSAFSNLMSISNPNSSLPLFPNFNMANPETSSPSSSNPSSLSSSPSSTCSSSSFSHFNNPPNQKEFGNTDLSASSPSSTSSSTSYFSHPFGNIGSTKEETSSIERRNSFSGFPSSSTNLPSSSPSQILKPFNPFDLNDFAYRPNGNGFFNFDFSTNNSITSNNNTPINFPSPSPSSSTNIVSLANFESLKNNNIKTFLESPPPVPRSSNLKERKTDFRKEIDMKDKWSPISVRFRSVIQHAIERKLFAVIGENFQSCKSCQQSNLSGGQIRILYHPNLKIGEGLSSEIFIGIKEDDGMEVAIKILKEYEEIEPEANSFPFFDERANSHEYNPQLPSPSSSPSNSPAVHNNNNFFSSNSQKMFKSELEKLKLRNGVSGIVKYFTTCTIHESCAIGNNESKFYQRKCLVFELMECSLNELVEYWKTKKIMYGLVFYQTCQYIVGSVLQTLVDLNKMNDTDYYAANRDIKPGNIMIDRLHQVKLIDFNFTKESYSSPKETINYSVMYSPPEALGFPRFSHPTSDLYSLGLITYYLFTGNENWGNAGNLACAPNSPIFKGIPRSLGFPPNKCYTAEHFLKILIVKDPQHRAYWQRRKGKCHENLLQHPFFWDSRKCNNFLISLGNLVRASIPEMRQVKERIERILNKMNVTFWWEVIEKNFPKLWNAKKQKVKEENLNDALGLLRFIRYCYIHGKEQLEEDKFFLFKPIFLDLFPSLVIDCWETCQSSDALYQHPLLQPILSSPFHSSLIPTFDDIAWY